MAKNTTNNTKKEVSKPQQPKKKQKNSYLWWMYGIIFVIFVTLGLKSLQDSQLPAQF
ncbi:hypothetical protein IJU97_06660 [bacterium]|nr:hypothetical protein [bacterium]